MNVFTKKKPGTTKTEPSFEQLTATEKIRCLLQSRTRRRSLMQIAADLNDIAGEKANRSLAQSIARNMAGADASPEIVASLAKTTFNNLPPSNVRIISESALQGFADGSDLLSDQAKIALAEYVSNGFSTYDAATDQLKSTRTEEPRAITGIPPQYRNPDPVIEQAHAAYMAVLEARRRA